jgi:hypothetical protein
MDYKFLMVLKVIITIYSALLAIGGERGGGGGEREREREYLSIDPMHPPMGTKHTISLAIVFQKSAP